MAKKLVVISASVAGFLLLIALIFGLSNFQGWASKDPWFDLDSNGDYIVSLEASIHRIGHDGEPSSQLAPGREVAALPFGEDFLYESDNRIWQFSAAKGIGVPVTNPDAKQIDWYPSWAPKVNRVMFTRSEGRRLKGTGGIGGASYDVYTVKLDGTDVRRLTHEKFFAVSVSPRSNSGEYLYFVGRTPFQPFEESSAVYRLDLVSNALSTVQGTVGAVTVSVSRDGKRLLVLRGPDYYSIELRDLQGSMSRIIKTPGSGHIIHAMFSDDDKSVLFLEDKTRSDRFCIMKLDLATNVETCVVRLYSP